jgi:hypothetical protein
MKWVAALVLAAGAAQAQDIGGRYEVAGKGFDGAAYRGTAVIRSTSDVTCEIEWTTGGQVSRGICMRQGDTFAASYVIGNTIGMAIYQVRPDGTLDGTWTISGSDGVGTEMLFPGG